MDGKERGQMDIIGAVLLSISLGAIVIGLNLSERWGFTSVSFICCMVIGVAGAFFFIRHETATEQPLMNLHFFRNRTFSLGNTITLLSYLVQQMNNFLMPFYLINMLLLRADKAGLMILALPILMMICAPISGNLADKKGPRLPTGIGLVLFFTGCLVMALLGEKMAIGVGLAALMLMGIGNGFSVAPINAAIMDAVPSQNVGVASGAVTTMRTLGQAVGVLFATVVLTLRQPVYTYFSPERAYLFAQRDAYFFAAFIMIITLILVWRLPREQ